MKLILKEALLLGVNEAETGNLMAKIEYQNLLTYKSNVSRTFAWQEQAPKILHIWNEEVDFQIRDKSLVSSMIRLTIYNDDPRGPKEVGYEEFCYPLLYYNGHGIKDHFLIFKDNLAVGKVHL